MKYKVTNKYDLELSTIKQMYSDSDTIVYISDIDTYEIIYANDALMMALGNPTIEHKKCYNVLQNYDKPCPFCTNDLINDLDGKAYVWNWYNSLIHKQYKITDRTITMNDGKKLRLEIAETTDEDAEYYKLDDSLFDSIQRETMSIFISNDNFQKTIDNAFNIIGKQMKASRVYLFQFNTIEETMSNTFEWCGEDTEPMIEKLQNLSFSSMPWWSKKILNKQKIYIENVENLPKSASSEKELLLLQGIKQLLVYPVIIDNEVFGFLGMDYVHNNYKFSKANLRSFSILTNTITAGIKNKIAEAEIKKSRERYIDIFESTGTSSLILDLEGNIIKANKTADIMLDDNNIEGNNFTKYLHNYDDFHDFTKEKHTNKTEDIALIDFRNDKIINVSATINLLADGTTYIISMIDVTEKIELISELEYIGSHDTLTNCHNRFYFEKYFSDMISAYDTLTLLLVDIDGLKIINDTLGHATGDSVLKSFGDIINKSLVSKKLFVRMGGDEFLIVYIDVDNDIVNSEMAQLKKLTSEYNENSECPINYSVGTVIDEFNSKSIDELVSIADSKMYLEKSFKDKSNKGAAISLLAKVLNTKDNYTQMHSERISENIIVLGEKYGLSSHHLSKLRLIAKFHDIGKVGVSNELLLSSKKLNAEELESIRKHSLIGHSIATSTPLLEHIADYILYHHERVDGSGYPRGLKAGEIPFFSRMINVADSFDAMTSNRPYKKSLTLEEAVSELISCKGTQFDADIVDKFVECIKDGNIIVE